MAKLFGLYGDLGNKGTHMYYNMMNWTGDLGLTTTHETSTRPDVCRLMYTYK